MKTIGVLGGHGPQATIDFEARIHTVSQELFPFQENPDYPPMVVYYYRYSLFVTRDEQMPVFPLQPDPRLVDAVKKLGKCADFLVMPCNGVHEVTDALEQASGLKVLNMIELTLEEVKKREWKKVGVVAFGPPIVYSVPLEKMGIAYASISQKLANELKKAIVKYQFALEDAADRAIANEAIAVLRSQRVDGIILGCTEIPFLLEEASDAPDLLNPVQFLAEAAVRYALE